MPPKRKRGATDNSSGHGGKKKSSDESSIPNTRSQLKAANDDPAKTPRCATSQDSVSHANMAKGGGGDSVNSRGKGGKGG